MNERILCNTIDCIFWISLSEASRLKYGRFTESLSEYVGYCGREQIGVQMRRIETRDAIYNIPECEGFSKKGFSGHLDWSKYPQGGHLDDKAAERLEANKKKTRSYRTHMRQAKE